MLRATALQTVNKNYLGALLKNPPAPALAWTTSVPASWILAVSFSSWSWGNSTFGVHWMGKKKLLPIPEPLQIQHKHSIFCTTAVVINNSQLGKMSFPSSQLVWHWATVKVRAGVTAWPGTGTQPCPVFSGTNHSFSAKPGLAMAPHTV